MKNIKIKYYKKERNFIVIKTKKGQIWKSFDNGKNWILFSKF